MTLEDLGNVGEFTAAIATLVTLVYLALQIRQNTRSVRSAAYQSAVASSVQLGTMLAGVRRGRSSRLAASLGSR